MPHPSTHVKGIIAAPEILEKKAAARAVLGQIEEWAQTYPWHRESGGAMAYAVLCVLVRRGQSLGRTCLHMGCRTLAERAGINKGSVAKALALLNRLGVVYQTQPALGRSPAAYMLLPSTQSIPARLELENLSVGGNSSSGTDRSPLTAIATHGIVRIGLCSFPFAANLLDVRKVARFADIVRKVAHFSKLASSDQYRHGGALGRAFLPGQPGWMVFEAIRLNKFNKIRVAPLARELGIPVRSVWRYLGLLEQVGCVRREGGTVQSVHNLPVDLTHRRQGVVVSGHAKERTKREPFLRLVSVAARRERERRYAMADEHGRQGSWPVFEQGDRRQWHAASIYGEGVLGVVPIS